MRLPIYRVRISSWILSWIFELDFRVGFPSWIFELGFFGGIFLAGSPNTTPIGQDRASQWRSVLFDPYLFGVRPRYFVFLDAFFSRFLGTRWQEEQGWRSGESARLPPMCPGFNSRTRRHMWVEFVVGPLLCSERFFSGYSGFPLSSKTNISQIPIRSLNARTFLNESL